MAAGGGLVFAPLAQTYTYSCATDFAFDSRQANRIFFAACGTYISIGPRREETPEERAAREEREATWRQRQEEARGADERAEVLLKTHLGFFRYRIFQVTGSLMTPSKIWPGIEYLIRRHQKVQVIERGKVKTELCVISREGEPDADRIMSILDLIETDERQLWEMANVFPK